MNQRELETCFPDGQMDLDGHVLTAQETDQARQRAFSSSRAVPEAESIADDADRSVDAPIRHVDGESMLPLGDW